MSSKGNLKINFFLGTICLLLLAGLVFVWRQPFLTFYRNLIAKKTPASIDVRSLDASNFEMQNTNGGTEPENSNRDSQLKYRDLNYNDDAAEEVTQLELPVEYNLKAPFVRQAPFDDWSEPFKEACEEAAVLTVHYWHQGLDSVSQQKMKNDIITAVEWEKGYFGSHKDLTAAETVEYIKKFYGYTDVDLKYDITLDDIKQAVYGGFPVIVPAAGREMGNENFRTPGPLYHMTVIKGWTKKGGIITNDPGTRRGQDYIYNADRLFNSIHDWNGGDVNKGRKAMIIIKK